MTTKDILRELNHFLFNNRSSGTTTLIKKISDENDVHILVHRDNVLKQIKDSINFLEKRNL